MGPIDASALAGIHRAELTLEKSATNLARLSVSGAKDGAPGAADSAGPDDMVGDIVSLSLASVQMAASVRVARVANETSKRLIDLVA